MSNTIEGVTVNIFREFNLFDAMPEWARKIIREANDDVHVEPLARLFVEMRKRNLSQQYISYELRKACR